MFFVYILVCLETGRTYVGHTDNLLRRYRAHCDGGTRTTRECLRQPVVAHWEPCETRAEAMRRERYYRSGSGHRRKCELVTASLALFGGHSSVG